MAMEEVLFSFSIVIGKYADYLTHKKEGNFFGVRDQVDWIHKELQAIRRILKNEEERVDKKEIKIRGAQVREVAYEAEDILDTLILRTEQRKKQTMIKRYALILIARFNFRLEIKPMNAKMRVLQIKTGPTNDEMIRDHTNPSSDEIIEEHTTPSSDEIIEEHTTPHHPFITTEHEPYGLEEDVKLLKSRLVEEVSERRVISIVGKGGIGKTTLARVVYNSEAVLRHFAYRAWICVSPEYTESELLDAICDSIMHRYKFMAIERKREMISYFLMDERYIIVLDDVWDIKAWKLLESVLPDTRNGSRVLLTTRSRNLSDAVDPRSPPYEMKPMSLEKSWMLLLKVSGRKETDYSPELIKAGKKIVDLSGGLPLAITTIGSFLRNRNDNWWLKVSEEISKAYRDQPTLSLLPISILEFSYNGLPAFLKPLFLYFLVFPRGYQIPVRRLFGLWLAEGILTQLDEGDRWENHLRSLSYRSMIEIERTELDGKPKTVRMHSLIHELFQSKARDNNIVHIHNSSSNNNNNSEDSLAQPQTGGVRRLVECTDISEDSSLEPCIQKSRSFMSFNFRKGDVPAEATGRFIGRVIQKGCFGLLRVLDLERVYKPTLPQSLGKLLLLKYLGLRWTFLDTLPSSVGELSYLETLDVKHTHISRIPNSIWKLKNLKHMYLNEIDFDFGIDIDISVGHNIAMQKLQTLLGLSIDMKNPVTSSLYGLVSLKKLGLTCRGTLDEDFVHWISGLKDIETLRLRSRDVYGQPSTLQLGSFSNLSQLSNLYLLGSLSSHSSRPLPALELPQNITVLTLSVSQLKEDPMPTLELLQNLRALRLLAHSYTGRKMVCSSKGFPRLRVMKLWMLEELEEWLVEQGAMVNLEKLEIRCCKRLKEVPQVLLQLPSMRTLILTNLSEAFKAKVEAKKSDHLSVTVNNWDFPTFGEDQVTNLGGQSSG